MSDLDTRSRDGRLGALGVSITLALLGFLLGSLVAVVLTYVLFYGFGVPVTPVTQLFVSLVSLQGIGFPAVAFGYIRFRDLPPGFIPVRTPTLRELGIAIGGWLLVLVLVQISGAVVQIAGVEPASNQAAETAFENPGIIPWLIPLVFLLNGPGEELLFRGAIQGRLRLSFGPVVSIVLASVMFAPAHVLALLGSPTAVAVTIALLFIPALVFGAAYEYTENIVVPSLIHGLYNATLFGLIYVVSTQGFDSASILVGL